jgi:hypothetical protein
MSAPPIDKSFLGLVQDMKMRLALVERRLPPDLPPPYALPDRLSETGQQITDWNNAVEPGFYYGIGAANSPVGQPGQPTINWTMGIVRWHPGDSGGFRISQNVREARATDRVVSYTRYGTVSGGVLSSPQPWMEERPGAPLRGLGADRAGVYAGYWEMWQDTDGAQGLYVGNKSGGWRLFSGVMTDPAVAWTLNSTSGAVITVGRTAIFTVPTVLETNETLLAQSIGVGTGFGFIGPTGVVRGASNTTLTVRFMQLGSTVTQALSITWQIVQQ